MEVREPPTEAESQGSNLECQTQWQVALPTEPSHWPMDYHFASLVFVSRQGIDFGSLKWYGEGLGWVW